jgi:hypothetical protein
MTTPVFTPPPSVIPTRGSATFAADASAWVTWQSGFEPQLSTAMPWVAARVVEVAQSVTDAATQVGLATDQVGLATAQVGLATTQAGNAASSAAAAVVTANATVWVSGSDYAQFANVVSPIDAGTYRSKVAINNSVVDPSSDLTRFAIISNSGGGSSFAALTTSAVTALTPAAEVDIDLADTEYFKLAVDQATALTTSNVKTLDTFTLSIAGLTGAAITYPASFNFTGATPASPVTGETLVLEAETTDGGTTFNVKVGSNPANVAANMNLEANDFFSLDLVDHTGFSVTNTAEDLSTFNLEVTGAVKSFTSLDFSAPTEIGNFNVSNEANDPQNIKFTDDGLTLFVGDGSTVTVYKYTLTKAFDIKTSVYSGVSLNLTNELSSLRSLYFAHSGTKLYVGGNSNNVYQYDMTTAYDLNTATFNQIASMANSINIYCMSFKPDGLVFYVGQNQATLQTYTLTTAFDLTTASYQGAHNFSAQISNITDFWLSANGTKLILLAYHISGREVVSYDLTNAYVMTTAIYNSGRYELDNSNSFGMEISLDETTLYLAQSSPVDQIIAISLSVDTFATTSFPASFNFNCGVKPATLIAGERLILEAQTTDGGANWYLTDLTTPAVDIKVGMVPLLTQKVTTSESSIAAIDFTLTGDYNNYMIIWDNCLPVTDQGVLELRMSNNRGASYCSNYKQVYPYTSIPTASVILGAINLTGSVGYANNAGEFCAGSINLHVKNAVGVINRGTIHGTSMQVSGTGVFERNVVGGMSNEAPGYDANAIRISFNNGNVASGTFTLYGMNGA